LALMPIRRRLPPGRLRLGLVDGTSFVADADEPLLTMYDEVWIQHAYLPTSRSTLRNATVVDVGANVGVFSVWAAQYLGARQVVAVEPSVRSAADLLTNLHNNRAEQVAVLQAAVGGRRGYELLNRRGVRAMDTLYDHDIYGSQFGGGQTVRVVCLDDVFSLFGIGQCDLLKLDCEGAEYEILYEAPRAALDLVRNISLEWHVGLNEHRPEALQEFLEKAGFQVRLFPARDEEGGYMDAFRRET
jgi:FkbM family methyltransferase